MRHALTCCALVACDRGVDNSDCAIRCGADNACPHLSCVHTCCIDDDQRCFDPSRVLADDLRNYSLIPAEIVADRNSSISP